MSLAVAWTDDARKTFDYTVQQIENKWGVRPAENFIRDTNRIINAISIQPFIFKASFLYYKHSQSGYFKTNIYVL